MTKHTPGPWTAEPPKYAEDRCGWKIANGFGVAYGWIATGYAPICPLTEANALLIAAAPELLAALQDACASLELQAETYRHWANVRDREANLGLADELARNASIYRRAIAKATGQ